jgi:hypothetical protein
MNFIKIVPNYSDLWYILNNREENSEVVDILSPSDEAYLVHLKSDLKNDNKRIFLVVLGGSWNISLIVCKDSTTISNNNYLTCGWYANDVISSKIIEDYMVGCKGRYKHSLSNDLFLLYSFLLNGLKVSRNSILIECLDE